MAMFGFSMASCGDQLHARHPPKGNGPEIDKARNLLVTMTISWIECFLLISDRCYATAFIMKAARHAACM